MDGSAGEKLCPGPNVKKSVPERLPGCGTAGKVRGRETEVTPLFLHGERCGRLQDLRRGIHAEPCFNRAHRDFRVGSETRWGEREGESARAVGLDGTGAERSLGLDGGEEAPRLLSHRADIRDLVVGALQLFRKILRRGVGADSEDHHLPALLLDGLRVGKELVVELRRSSNSICWWAAPPGCRR